MIGSGGLRGVTVIHLLRLMLVIISHDRGASTASTTPISWSGGGIPT